MKALKKFDEWYQVRLDEAGESAAWQKGNKAAVYGSPNAAERLPAWEREEYEKGYQTGLQSHDRPTPEEEPEPDWGGLKRTEKSREVGRQHGESNLKRLDWKELQSSGYGDLDPDEYLAAYDQVQKEKGRESDPGSFYRQAEKDPLGAIFGS